MPIEKNGHTDRLRGKEGRVGITQPPQTDEALGLRASVTAGQELQCNSVIINGNFEASQKLYLLQCSHTIL